MSTRHRLDEDVEASKQPILSTETHLHFKSLSDTPSPPPPPPPPNRQSNLSNAQVNAKYYPQDARSNSNSSKHEDEWTTRATVDSHSPETGRSSGVTFASQEKSTPPTVRSGKRKDRQQWTEQIDRSHSSVTRTHSNHANCSCSSPSRVNGNGNNNHKSHSRSLFTAPDGGWGWVVVFASFMISLIADGISFSFGIIFLELSDYFNASKSKTAFVGSLFMSIPLLVGPLASALTDRYGCRKITIVSGIISSIGFILGHLSTCIEHLFIAFSIAGAGLALSYVTSIVIVAYYFEKRRSLATGLAVCGTGFGTFIFPPLTIHLLDEYTWRGTLLIMSGFFLNIVVFGALMRDLPATNDDVDCDSESSMAIVDTFSRESEEPYTRKRLATYSGSKVTTPDINITPFDSTGGCNKSTKGIKSVSPRMTSSMVHIPTYLTHRGSTCDNQDVLNELWSKKGGYLNRLLEKYPEIVRPMIHLFPPSTGPINNSGTRICPPPPPPPAPSLPSGGPVSAAGGPISSPPPPPPRAAACTPLSPTFVACPSSATPTSATAGHSLVNSTFTTGHNGESCSSSPPLTAASTAAATVVEKTTTDASREATSNTISPGTACNSHSFTATAAPTTTTTSSSNNNDNCSSSGNNNNNNNYNCTVNSYMYNHSNNNYNGSHENADPGHLIFNNNNESAPSSVKSPALISNISIRSPKIISKRLSVNPIGYRLNSLIPFEHGCQAKKLQRGSITYRSAMLNIRRYRTRSSSCPDMVAVAGRVTHTVTVVDHLNRCFTLNPFVLSLSLSPPSRLLGLRM